MVLTLLVLGMVPSLAGTVPLWRVVILHEGGTFLVGLNSLKLLSDKLSWAWA